MWLNKSPLHWNCHTSRKRERINDDGSFKHHQKGAITGTFTGDWYLRKGPKESRDKLGEWLQKTTIRQRINEGWSRPSLTASPLTRGDPEYQKEKNLTDVTSAKLCG